jgi:hypothetical protein
MVAQKRFLSVKQTTGKADAPEPTPPVPPPSLSKSEQIRAALLGKKGTPPASAG